MSVPIPQTPRPRPLTSFQQEMAERFSGIIWFEAASGDDIKLHLLDYDYHSEFDETAVYSKRPYLAYYKGPIRMYQNYLLIVKFPDHEKSYVVAKHVHDDIELLEQWCPCLTCRVSSMNPLKYLWCPQCTRCIKAGPAFADKRYVAIAKAVKDGKYTHPSYTTRMIEIASLCVMAAVYYYAL